MTRILLLLALLAACSDQAGKPGHLCKADGACNGTMRCLPIPSQLRGAMFVCTPILDNSPQSSTLRPR